VAAAADLLCGCAAVAAAALSSFYCTLHFLITSPERDFSLVGHFLALFL
jgi:hypothetical protein